MKRECIPSGDTRTAILAQMSRRWGKALFALVAVLAILIAAGISPAYAMADTVRIGFFNSDKYGYVGATGDLRGYDVQLSKTIGMYGGFDAEMVGFDNVADMEDALRTGKVDALIDFLQTKKREQEFIFSSNPILEELVSLYTLNSPDAPTSDEISKIAELRIGYVSDAGYLDYFMDYCAESGVEPQMTSFHDEPAMISAMERGETDACLTGSAVPTGYRALVSLPPLSSYMMFRAEDTELRSRIDTAINQIKTDYPDYISNLYRQYVSSHKNEMSPLTSQEREYLTAHSELTVALIQNAEPFTVENEDGSLGGVIPDYYKTLGEKLGVTFKFVAYDSTQNAIDAVAGGKADILGHYYGDIIIAEREGLYDTMEYGSTECARLTRSDFSGQVKTIAVTNRTANLLAEQLDPDIHLEAYPNIEACYQALMQGDVDAVIGFMTGITWLINQHTMRGASLSILSDVTLGIRGAVSNENPTLLFVLNKAIAVSSDTMDEAIIANAVDSKPDLRTALENLPLGFTIAVVTILSVLVILLIITLVLLARGNKERVALLNREMDEDGLTGANSRRYGTELLNRELLLFQRYGDGPLIAMLDVDYFKQKNDRFGHEYGDYVLKRVVEVLRETLRQSDTIIRWGGDEFILVCQRPRGDGANRVLEKVVRAINSSDFLMGGKGEQITVSVGASFFSTEDEDIASALRRCDDALYEAKNIRNTYCIVSCEASGEPSE